MTRHIKENEQGKEAEVVRLRTPPRKIWIDNRHLVDGIIILLVIGEANCPYQFHIG